MYGAVVDLQNDAGMRNAGGFRDFLARKVVAYQLVTEDLADVVLGAMRHAILRSPGHDRRRRKVGDAGVAGAHVVRVIRADGFGRTLDRKSVVEGTGGSVRVDLGGWRI